MAIGGTHGIAAVKGGRNYCLVPGLTMRGLRQGEWLCLLLDHRRLRISKVEKLPLSAAVLREIGGLGTIEGYDSRGGIVKARCYFGRDYYKILSRNRGFMSKIWHELSSRAGIRQFLKIYPPPRRRA